MSQQNNRNWYAIRIKPRQEKKVQKLLELKAIENYLPLKEEIHEWSDRKKKVVVPIITGYLFVRITLVEKENVYKTDGVLSFVSEKGEMVKIPDNQIERLQFMVKKTNGAIEFSETSLAKGDKVRVTRGDLIGLTGILRETHGKFKVIVQIEGLGCAMARVPIDAIESIA